MLQSVAIMYAHTAFLDLPPNFLNGFRKPSNLESKCSTTLSTSLYIRGTVRSTTRSLRNLNPNARQHFRPLNLLKANVANKCQSQHFEAHAVRLMLLSVAQHAHVCSHVCPARCRQQAAAGAHPLLGLEGSCAHHSVGGWVGLTHVHVD